MTKKHLRLIVDPDTGKQFYRKSLGEATKNHKTDDEDLKSGGLIVFEENFCGFNPGLFVMRFLGKLNPHEDLLFTRPQRPSKAFNLHENRPIWYEKNKVGVNQISKMMPNLSEILRLPKITNGNCRPTAIRLLKRGGVSDREIVTVSGIYFYNKL